MFSYVSPYIKVLSAEISFSFDEQFIGACIEPKLMIITELMEGNTLHKFMLTTRPNPLDLKLSISFALDISRGMEFLNASGIIHRDLKPSNKMIHFIHHYKRNEDLRN